MPAFDRSTPTVDLNNYIIERDVLSRIPEQLARQHKLIPLFRIRDSLTIAISDPANIIAIDEVRAVSGCDVQVVKAEESAIVMAIEQNYNVDNYIEEIVKELQGMSADFVHDKNLDSSRIQKITAEPPVIKMVNLIIFQALKDRASDIHIEPSEKKIMVRLRIDGVLHTMISLPAELEMPIVSRIKVISKLDIMESRRPQDGHFAMKMGEREIDVRVSIFPVNFGEKVVMRILDRSAAFLNLEKLGFSEEKRKKFEEMIHKPYGIILVTGPTGSGKTSTLYASLNKINAKDKNIVTLEDPREYLLEGINQGEVNMAIGFTFASGLRSILRQDPDVIMIGEIRDAETAQISMRAALTGHLVLSTLHTNDATGAVTRLIDMEVEPFLISSTVIGVLAQRLVRAVCPGCKEEYQPSEDVIGKLGLDKNAKVMLCRGKGCVQCRQTGYKGRLGIFELLEVNDQIRECINNRKSTTDIKQAAQKSGMKTLAQDGFDKVLKGLTTPEEVFRVAYIDEQG